MLHCRDSNLPPPFGPNVGMFWPSSTFFARVVPTICAHQDQVNLLSPRTDVCFFLFFLLDKGREKGEGEGEGEGAVVRIVAFSK